MLHYDFILMLLLNERACMPVHEEEEREGKLLNILLIDLYCSFIHLFNVQHAISRRTGHFGGYYAAFNFCALGGLVGLHSSTTRCQQ